MVDNPISNQISTPGSSPIQPTQPVGPNQPTVGAGEEGQERPFSIAPEGGKVQPTETQSTRPSPMEVAGDTARQHVQMSPEDLSQQIEKLQQQLSDVNTKLADPNFTKTLSPEHLKALQQVAQKMNHDLQTIAKNSNGTFNPPKQEAGKGPVEFVTQWLDGAQGTLGGALNYLQGMQKPDITSFMKMQYAVQRATQRGELFASIIGSTVSGVKTIMSTQLG